MCVSYVHIFDTCTYTHHIREVNEKYLGMFRTINPKVIIFFFVCVCVFVLTCTHVYLCMPALEEEEDQLSSSIASHLILFFETKYSL